jgi:allantoicase
MADTHQSQPLVAAPPEFTHLIDLASERLGGKALLASDEFFAGKENLLKPTRPVFIPDKYTDLGKWMDGWESRRRRTPGHDWCIIALGRPGRIVGVNVDTTHFNGNQPETCTIEAVEMPAGTTATEMTALSVPWVEIVPSTPLKPSSEHFIGVRPDFASRRFTHLRLNIFPDGGVARLRVHGEVMPDWSALAAADADIDLAAAENAGLVIAANNMHFGSRHNLIMPGRAANMGDGWETRRKRGLKGGEFDWCVVRLGHRGVVSRIEVDTNHFKGNYPESCEIDACDACAGADFDPEAAPWSTLLPRTRLSPSTQHHYERELTAAREQPCTHVRLKIYPDGGVSRLRIWGRIRL